MNFLGKIVILMGFFRKLFVLVRSFIRAVGGIFFPRDTKK